MRHPNARIFNTYGPVDADEHYMVPRTDLLSDLVNQITEGQYFTIHAPRQVGKTTLLRQIVRHLAKESDFVPVALSLEGLEGASASSFLNVFWSEFGNELITALQNKGKDTNQLRTVVEDCKPSDFAELLLAWRKVYASIGSCRIILIVDEFDAIPQDAISSMLQIWRNIYLSDQNARSLHSVVLVGLQNIATLNFGRSSPFNIAREVRLPNFVQDQVSDLYEQHRVTSGQYVEVDVVEAIFLLTAGQPFLVNRIGAILTEQVAKDSAQPITSIELERTKQILLRERNWNFETICRRAEVYRQEVLEILFGKPYRFAIHNPLVHYLSMHGIVADNGYGDCRIANPIYSQILTEYLGPPNRSYQGDILVNGNDARTYVHGDGLDMVLILHDFRTFVERRGRQAFEVSPTPHEATGQYLLMSYLEAITRQLGGAVLAETPSGDDILDLIVVYGKQRYIVETKIWRGPKKFEDGRDQLVRYLDKERQKTGYYVVFHTRPNVYGKLEREELEFKLAVDGKDLHVYIVRLGEILDAESE